MSADRMWCRKRSFLTINLHRNGSKTLYVHAEISTAVIVSLTLECHFIKVKPFIRRMSIVEKKLSARLAATTLKVNDDHQSNRR